MKSRTIEKLLRRLVWRMSLECPHAALCGSAKREFDEPPADPGSPPVGPDHDFLEGRPLTTEPEHPHVAHRDHPHR